MGFWWISYIILYYNSPLMQTMGLLPDTQNSGLHMRQECQGRFPRHRLQRKPLVSDPAMHHGTCFTHAPWCMSGSLNRGGGDNVPGIPGACTTRNFSHLVRGPSMVLTLLRCCWIVKQQELIHRSTRKVSVITQSSVVTAQSNIIFHASDNWLKHYLNQIL